MHVLILPSWYPSNEQDINGVFFREQALALKSHGLTIGVVTLSLLSLRDLRNILGYRTTRVQFTNDNGVPTYRKPYRNWFYKLPVLGKLQYLLVARRLFLQYVANHGRPDVIHVHSMIDAGIAAMYCKARYNIPYVVTEHSTSFARNLLSQRELRLIRIIAEQSDMNIAVSTPFANLLREKTGQEWKVIPNIVHEQFFRKINNIVDRSSFRFINVCYLTEKKRVDLLVKAFFSTFRGNPRIQLCIGGVGDQLFSLKQLTSNLGLDGQVVFLGALSRNQVMDEVENADVFVLSSEFETFGVVLIEAMALGKPVISTRSGGPEDIVEDYNGILVPINDEKALGDAMRYMIDNYQKYNPQNIQQKCHDKFSEASVVRRLAHMYRQVLAEGKKSEFQSSFDRSD
jgi:glycosyltransferase involved in cell wall biosynthesis